jgi:hypothetical protein
MRFDSACAPVSSPQVSTSSGFRGNAVWTIGPPFTVRATGPVHASAVVTTQYTLTEPLRIVLLGYDPQAPGPNHCVPTAIPEGPPMSAPTITADWASVPPGTYCLDVQDAIPPESQPPYSWTATITHP